MDRRDVMLEDTWNVRNEGRATEIVNIWVNIIEYYSPLKLFKISSTIESKN